MSLGTSWGEGGYVRLEKAKAKGAGTCGINMYPYTVEAIDA